MVSSAIGAHPQPERQQKATSIIYIVLEATCTTLANHSKEAFLCPVLVFFFLLIYASSGDDCHLKWLNFINMQSHPLKARMFLALGWVSTPFSKHFLEILNKTVFPHNPVILSTINLLGILKNHVVIIFIFLNNCQI